LTIDEGIKAMVMGLQWYNGNDGNGVRSCNETLMCDRGYSWLDLCE